MAKRVSPDEKPFSPIPNSLVQDALNPVEAPEAATIVPFVERDLSKQFLHVVEGAVEQKKGKGKKEEEEPRPAPKAKKPEIVKRTLLSPSEDADIESVVRAMAYELETPLKLSHVLRATMALLTHSRDELIKQCQKGAGKPGLKRPSNLDDAAIAVFEHNLTLLIQTALKNTRNME